MKVLIAKQNEGIIKVFLPRVKFAESSKNTVTFSVSEPRFTKLCAFVKDMGFNPYALMTW